VTKLPNPVDIHVGSRIRLRRMMIGMSQERLGERLGLTFQQVQKYEKGANRVGASRLFAISNILEVPVEFFFADMPHNITDGMEKGDVKGMSEPDETAFVMDFVSSSEGLQLNTAFKKIGSQETRRKIVELIKTLAAE